jgi:hypothetical protein
MQPRTDIRHRIFAALAVMSEGEGALRFLDYVGERDREALASLIPLYAGEGQEGLDLDQFVRHLVASEHFSSIAEIHPAWILEHLRGEPPRVVGLILRSLPSRHVRYLLEHLPPMLRDRMPNMLESFAVARPILELMRRRFERHFLPMRVTRSIEHPGFEHLFFLRGEELAELIRDVGLQELAIALSGMSSKVLHLIFNRLSLKDAKRLQRRIKGLSGVSTELYRQARGNVLETEGQHEGAERMLLSVGLVALACAMDREHEHLAKLLMQKIAPADGYLLKRFMGERKLRGGAEVAEQRRAMILGIVGVLAAEGRISQEWRRFAPDAEPPPPESPDEPLDRSISEETGSLKTLE